MLHYIALVLECCAKRVEKWQEFALGSKSSKLNRRVMDRLTHGFGGDCDWLVQCFNANIHDLVQVGGLTAIDETILGFEEQSGHLIHIPRNPNDTGIKLYLECYNLTTSSLPVCYTVMVDTEAHTLTPRRVLDHMLAQHPRGIPIGVIADSFFSSLGWLRIKSSIPTLFSMTASDLGNLLPLFSHNLRYHQCRVFFFNGNVMLSIWVDNDIIVYGTNRFDLLQAEPIDPTLNVTGYYPVMGHDDLIKLTTLSLDALRALAKKMGESCGECVIGIEVDSFLFNCTSHWVR